jgi:adenosylhomocysteine nucleosidase
VPCARIGIVVGLAAEARIARRLDRSVAIGGGMAAGAESAVRRLIDEGAGALISLGVAGGLEPALRPGALIVPSEVIANDRRYPADPTLMQWLGGSTSHLILGADAVVASAAEKRRLRERTSAAAVDLESGAVARVAAMHGLPFAVLRAICDPAERALPLAALAALDAWGRIGLRQVVAAVASHPRQLPQLIALAADVRAARRSLLRRVRQLAPACR